MQGDPADSMFNMFGNKQSKGSTQADKDAFFKSFGMSSSSEQNPKNRVKDSAKDY